jgi:hypothetical protein
MKVKDLLRDEQRWTQGALARDYCGRECMPGSPDAEAWCLVGAIFRVYHEGSEINEAIDAVTRLIVGYRIDGIDEVEEWNDDPGRTFAEVKAVIEKADV